MRFSLAIACGAAATVLALEVLLQVLPVSSGLRMAETSSVEPQGRSLPLQSYRYSNGWAFENARRGEINREGFNNSADFNSADFADRHGVLVVGDSFIESLMLDYPDTIQGNLDRALGGGVFAAAVSGNGLADSLEAVRQFQPRLHARTVVLFVEPYDMSGLLASPEAGHSAFVLADGAVSLVHRPYKESKAKLPMLRSAFIRYFYYNLKFPAWVGGVMTFGRVAPAPAVSSEVQRRVLGHYFEQLRALGGTDVQFIFLLDGDRKAIYGGKRAVAPNWKGEDLQTFKAGARDAGFAVVDMQPVFAQHWASRRERMDFLPVDGHWNGVAHRLAAQQVLPLIQGAGRGKGSAPDDLPLR